MNYTKKAVKRTSIVFIISILSAGLAYLIRMVLARNLEPGEYGLFFSIHSLIMLLGIFTHFGLDRALVKYIPEFQVKKKFNLIKGSISITYLLTFISSIIFSLALVLLSSFLAENYFKNELAKPVLILFSAILIISVFKRNLRQIFNGFQKMKTYSMMYFFENLFILGFVLFLFYFNVNIISPVLAYLGSYLLVFFIFLPYFFKTFPFFNYRVRFSKKLTKKLFKFGVPLFLSGLGGIVILYTDTLILTYFGSLTEVGIYNVVVPTAMLLSFLSRSIIGVVFPMVSELWAKGLKEYIVEGTQLLQKYSLLVVLPLSLIMFSFSEFLIKFLFGAEYLSGSNVLKLLVIGLIFYIIAKINMYILNGIGKPKIFLKIMSIGAVFNLITNFYFIPKYGMFGAGMTSLASYLLILVFSIVYLIRNIKIKLPIISCSKIFISGVVFLAVIYLLKNILSVNIYLEIFICVFLSTIIYLALALALKAITFNELKILFQRLK